MATLTTTGITIETTGELVLRARGYLDTGLADLGLPPADYDATHEAALTYMAGALAAQIEQGLQVIADMLDPRTAPDSPVLDGYAAQVGLSRRPATASAYIVRATVASGTYTLPAGTVIRGGGTDGLATWTVDAATVIATTATLVEVTCQQTGPISLPDAALAVVTPLPTTVTVSYAASDGDDYTLGRDREVGALLRVRRARSLVAVPSCSRTGIRAALLALDWVIAATVSRYAAGVYRIYVYPPATTTAQRQEAVDAIGLRLGAARTLGDTGGDPAADDTGTYTEADGSSTTVTWYEGGDQAVTVAVTLTMAAGWSVAQVSAAVIAAVAATFAALDIGETVRYTAVYCAIASVEGVIGVALTLDGAGADITPATSTDYLIPETTVS